MTARTASRLQSAGLIAVAIVAAAIIALALAALATPAHAESEPPPALAAAAPAPPAAEPDTAAVVRRLGWPIGVLAAVTVAALSLGVAGQRRGRRELAWLARGTAATSAGAGAAIGSAVLDTLIAGGSPAAVGAAMVATILAFWRARRPEPGHRWRRPLPGEVQEESAICATCGLYASERDIPCTDGRTSDPSLQRGAAAGPLIAILACAAITAGAMGAWSCTGAQRREFAAAAIDCTAGQLAERADALRPLVGAAIRSGDWAAVRAAAMTALRDAVGCAGAAVVIEIERPPSVVTQALTTTGAPPDPVEVRAAWERLRREQLGGRSYVTRGGAL